MPSKALQIAQDLSDSIIAGPGPNFNPDYNLIDSDGLVRAIKRFAGVLAVFLFFLENLDGEFSRI
jgi:hypothetical protein